MKKFLICLSTLIPILSLSSTLTNESKFGHFPEENVVNIEKNINIGSNSQTFNDDDYYITEGKNYDTTYRIYVDNGNIGADGTRSLPDIEGKTNDYVIPNAKKNEWREHLVKGLSIDITTLAANKTEFLKKYKAITATYLYTYNFWNLRDGWTYVGGKKDPFNYIEPYTFSLTSGNYTAEIFEASDANHKNNEKARLRITQTWEGNILKVDFLLGVLYYWAWGSVYGHASLAQFTNDKYTLVSVANDGKDRTNVKVGRVQEDGSTFTSTINSNTKIPLLDTVDKQLKVEARKTEVSNAWYKATTAFTGFFYGSKKVGNTRYHLGLTLRIEANAVFNKDSNKLLFGSTLSRELRAFVTSEQVRFIYNSDFGSNMEIPYKGLTPDFYDIPLDATFKIPYVYIN